MRAGKKVRDNKKRINQLNELEPYLGLERALI